MKSVQVSPVLLHEVAADQRRASRPPRLAVHVHGGAHLVDELHVKKMYDYLTCKSEIEKGSSSMVHQYQLIKFFILATLPALQQSNIKMLPCTPLRSFSWQGASKMSVVGSWRNLTPRRDHSLVRLETRNSS